MPSNSSKIGAVISSICLVPGGTGFGGLAPQPQGGFVRNRSSYPVNGLLTEKNSIWRIRVAVGLVILRS